MDCRVVVEAAVPVYDVANTDEAVRIAISKTGEMLNPDLNYVEINMGERSCPHCDEALEPAFVAADESLVALELEMDVFNVEREEHASRIARKEIGSRLENIPLEILQIEVIQEDGAESEADPDTGVSTADSEETGTETPDIPTDVASIDESNTDDSAGADSSDDTTDDATDDSTDSSTDSSDGELPDFEDIIAEGDR